MPYPSHTDFDHLSAEMEAGLPAKAALRRLSALQREVAFARESLRSTDYFLREELGLVPDGEIFANMSMAACRQELDFLGRLENMPVLAGIHERLAVGLSASGQDAAALREVRRALAMNPLDEGLKYRLQALDGGDGPLSLAARDYRFSYQGFESGLPGPLPWEIVRFGDRIVLTDLKLMSLFSRPVSGSEWKQSGTRFSYPFGLHDDGRGGLWVCDLWSYKLCRLDADLNKNLEYDMRKLLRGGFEKPWPFLVCWFGGRMFVGVQNATNWRFSLASFDLDDPAGSATLYDDAEFGFIYRMACHGDYLYIVRLDQNDFSKIPGNVITRYRLKADGLLELSGRFLLESPVQQILPVKNGFFIKTFKSIIRTDSSLETLFSIPLPMNSSGASLSEVGFLCSPEGPDGGTLWFLDYLHSRINAFEV